MWKPGASKTGFNLGGACGNNVEMAKTTEREKNAAAVALGRLGGLKGGKALAKKLTAEERTQSARRAAVARWSKRKKKN